MRRMAMKDQILQVIKQIEVDHEINILFACESGSRAWGFPSKDSDYDVRFIYIHKKDWYLSIDQKRDVIEIPKRDRLSIPVHELLDVSGWELTKALRLFRKSNPPLLEWLRSSIIYYQSNSTIEKMNAIATQLFAPSSCVYHYLNMAKGNYREYLHGQKVKIKKYFYVLRPILAAKWIEKYNDIPPIEFHQLLEDIIPPSELKEQINLLLDHKMAGEELALEERIHLINQFIEEEMKFLEEYAKQLQTKVVDPTAQLDQLFRETLDEAW
jgi:uncharacterized protein